MIIILGYQRNPNSDLDIKKASMQVVNDYIIGAAGKISKSILFDDKFLFEPEIKFKHI